MTNDLYTHSRARFDYEASRKLLKEKYESKLIFAYNGGMFKASPEYMTFLTMYGDNLIVLKDLYENPVEVQADELLTIMKRRYKEQTTAWLIEFSELSQKK